MSEPPATQDRPPQVTAAAWVIMVGSAFVVLSMWDRIAALHTIGTRHGLQAFLDQYGLRSSGLDLAGIRAVAKVLSIVAAACATAMVILGWQTLLRSRGARLALGVLAVPLTVCGLLSDSIVTSGVAGGFLASGIAAAVATLWLGQARLWFDGRTPAAAARASAPSPFRSPPPSDRQTQQTRPFPHPPQASPPGNEPRPTPGWPSTQTSTWAPPATSAYDVRPQGRAARRPGALLVACILTWLSAASVSILLVVSSLALTADTQPILDQMHQQNPQLAQQGISDHLVVVLVFVMLGVFVVWALAAFAFATALFRGHRWGWYALVASAAGTALISLVGAVGSPLVLVVLAAAVATIVCLVRPEVRGWLRR